MSIEEMLDKIDILLKQKNIDPDSPEGIELENLIQNVMTIEEATEVWSRLDH